MLLEDFVFNLVHQAGGWIPLDKIVPSCRNKGYKVGSSDIIVMAIISNRLELRFQEDGKTNVAIKGT